MHTMTFLNRWLKQPFSDEMLTSDLEGLTTAHFIMVLKKYLLSFAKKVSLLVKLVTSVVSGLMSKSGEI